jgi:hypothetical protein
LKENEIKVKERHTLWHSILVAVIVAIVGSATNYIIWTKQQNKLLIEKSIEYKYELLKETAFVCAKFQKLQEGHLMYTIMNKKMGQDIPDYDRNIEVRSRNITKLNKSMADVYQASLEANQYVPKVQSQLILVQIFFGSKTKEAAIDYFKALNTTADEYIAILKRQKSEDASHKVKEYQLQDVAIIAGSRMNKALQKLLESMQTELGVPGSKL